MTQRAFEYRLYPTGEQAAALHRTFLTPAEEDGTDLTENIAVPVAGKPTFKAKPKGRVFRTFEMPHAMNAGKEEQIRAVHRVYTPLLVKCAALQYRRLLEGQKVTGLCDVKHVESALSARYKKSANSQAADAMSSWVALVEMEVRRIIRRTDSLTSERKRQLLYVNSANHWFNAEPDGTYLVPRSVKDETTGVFTKVPGAFDVVSAEDMKLLRSVVKHVRRHLVGLPDLGKVKTMKLDGPVCMYEGATSATSFDYWLKFSTLTKGNPVMLPVRSTFHEQARDGQWTLATQITVPRTGPVVIRMVKDVTPGTRPEPAGGIIGLDWGLKSLFASSEGDLFGRSFYVWLLNIDTDLTALAAALQRQGIKPSDSRRYRALQHRIRAYAKNEVNRVLNRVIDLYDPSVLVVEDLDFRHGGLSKRLNRIISRVGRAQVKQKLRDLTQDTGVNVVTVPAQYSSQECTGCGYVDDRNRINEMFRCRFCGRKGHADIEAARTVKSRRSWPSGSLLLGRPKILQRIDERFTQQWGTDPKAHRAKGRRTRAATAPLRPNADGLGKASNIGCLTEEHIENAA